MTTVLIARLGLLLALTLSSGGTAAAHAVVVASEPVDGAVLAVTPERVRVRFNEPVSLVASQVLDASGANVVDPSAGSVIDGVVEIVLPPSMPRGSYVASYRVVSLDGHPVSGSIVFSIGEVAKGVTLSSSNDGRWRFLWTMVRATLNAGLLGSAGGVMFLLFVARTDGRAESAARTINRLALLGVVAAVLSIGVQGGSLTGAPIEEFVSAVTWRTGLASTFGRSALIAIVGLVLIAVAVRWNSPVGRGVALMGAFLAILSYAFAGHVVTAGPGWITIPALLAHTSAVAFWIGSLLPLHAALSSENAAPVVRRFSTLAIGAVGVLLIAGLVIATLQVRSFSALFTTTYGWILVGKLVLVCGLLSLAALNKLRLTPAFSRHDAAAAVALRRTIAAELVIVAAILMLTAALGTTPPPRALASEHIHNPEHHAEEHHSHGLTLEVSSGRRNAKVTFASAHAGPNDVEIEIGGDGGETAAKEVVIVASNITAGVEPIRRAANPVRAGVWEVQRLNLIPAGEWSIRVEALVSDFEKLTFEDTVELR